MWSGLADIEFEEDEGKESGTGLCKTFLRETVCIVKVVQVDYMPGLKNCVDMNRLLWRRAAGMFEGGGIFKTERKGESSVGETGCVFVIELLQRGA